MIRQIQEYYLKERNSGRTAAIFGFVILISSVYVYSNCAPGGFMKGFSYTLCCLSLLMFITGIITVIYNNYRIRKTMALSHLDDATLKNAEITRMQKAMAYSYTGGLILFSATVICGLALAIITGSELLKGVGTGMIIMGILGVMAERVSMQRNARYLETLRSLQM